MTDLHRSEMRPLQGMQHRSEVEDLLAIEVKVVRSIVGITIPIEVLPQLDVRRLTGLMIPTAALQTIAIWMTIVICSPMILRVEVLLTAKKVLRFVKVNCLTVIVGLVVVVVVVVEGSSGGGGGKSRLVGGRPVAPHVHRHPVPQRAVRIRSRGLGHRRRDRPAHGRAQL